MNRRLREAVFLGLAGAAVGAAVAVLRYVRMPDPDLERGYVGLQGYAALDAYRSTVRITLDGTTRHWFPLLPIATGAGLALGLVLFGVLVLTKRRIALVSASSPTG